jgi:molybdate/tungstate transport system substrate-binding protein
MHCTGKWIRARVLPAVALGAVALTGCGTSTTSSTSSPSATAAPPAASAGGPSAAHGPVDVLYAGSLVNFMNTRLGPAFQKATGDTVNGYPAGSKELASDIKGRVRQGDVFISASPKVDAKLEGSANGGWVSWYAPFATTSLVLGYNPHSSFAARLKQGPWYKVITAPGFRLGFTDPKLDPKGALTVAALDQAAATYHDPALKALAGATSDVFPEETLVGRLQAGQLDAGFFYTVEASAARIPTVSLGAVHESGAYTVTVLHGAPHSAAAAAFVNYLLGPHGEALMRSVGLTVTPSPRVIGSGVPSSLSGVVRSSP